jgi:RNA polymerase sigma-54 factor
VALSPRLEFRQGQSLVITPQLQQAIKLLQLSNLELDAFVDAELERNPLLTREDPPEDAYEAGPAERDAEPSHDLEPLRDSAPGGEVERDLDARADDIHVDAAPGDRAAGDAPAGEPGDPQMLGDWSRAGKGAGFDGLGDEAGAAREPDPTLQEHLSAQIVLLGLAGADLAIANVLLDAVDEGGYLRADVADVGARLGCGPERVEALLARLHGLEPTGVFARDVRECLMLQLAERDRLDPAMQALLDNLPLLAKRDLAALTRLCGVDTEDLREMMAEVRALTPRPGAAFGGGPVQAVVPDVFVREDGLGLWRVELNADTLPRVLLDKRYHARVSAGARSDAEKTFVADCHAQASWLVKSLDQRVRTILKVSSEIVRQQDGFLALGVEHLRPLNLKTVADAIGMHESTVSRVTSNKYIATPRGVFEMKFFFTSSLASNDGGEAHSAESVRHRIRHLIDAELDNREGVLSDDRIVEILKETGVEIARRTVAKYREAMRIPSSVERRREALAAG